MSKVEIKRLSPENPSAARSRAAIAAYSKNEGFFQEQILGDPRYTGRTVVIGDERVLAVGPLDSGISSPDSEEKRKFSEDFEKARRELSEEEWEGIYWGKVLPPLVE